MTEREQIKQIGQEIANIIDRAGEEYDLSYAAIVGILEFHKHSLIQEGLEEEENDIVG